MKIAELREMSDDQLLATLNAAKETLFRLRIRAQTERLLIARVHTLQTQRAAAASGSASKTGGVAHA